MKAPPPVLVLRAFDSLLYDSHYTHACTHANYTCMHTKTPYTLSLTVAQVNQYLDDLALSNAKKDRAGMKKALQLLLRNTSALEQKWLIRMILKVGAILIQIL